MRLFISCMITMVMLLLAGCFQLETVVRVNMDGSGTVEERMLISRKMLAQMEGIMQGFAPQGRVKPQPLNLFDPKKLKAQAGKMGKGVVYRSGKKVETDDFTGYSAVYSFAEIGKLRLGGEKGNSGSDPVADAKPSMPVVFEFVKGPPAVLTFKQPKKADARPEAAQPPAASPADTPKASPQEAEKIAELFAGMKFLLVLEVNGRIVETNAQYRDGNRLTLAELDFGKIGSALPQLEKLGQLQGSSPEEAMELLKDFPGMRIDMNERLKVVFGG